MWAWVNDILRVLLMVAGWAPWVCLFLSAWKRSLLPLAWADEVFGRDKSTPGLSNKLKYLVILGALTLWMNAVLWASLIPSQIFEWYSFPKVCIVPRTFWGFLSIHDASWYHFSTEHFANNNLCMWTLGPLLLSYNRRTFVFATIFVSFASEFLVWLLAPPGGCHAGFSSVVFGWFGVLTVALLLDCPPKIWRCALLLIMGSFLGLHFYGAVLSGDHQEGVSWHSHAFGLAAGLLFGVLCFGRGWFRFQGFEDRVRPVGEDPSLVEVLEKLTRELCRSCTEGFKDVFACAIFCTPAPSAAAPESESDAGE